MVSGLRIAWLILSVIAAAFVMPVTLAQSPLTGDAHDSPLHPAEAAQNEEREDVPGTATRFDAWHGRIELKRQNTSRGTPEESTKTTLRLESFFTGTMALLRIDLPFPDEETDFNGSLFNSRLGDIKTRVGFRPVQVSGYSFPSFIEITFPTADPETLGSGKSAGVRMLVPVTLYSVDPALHKARLEAMVQQVNSVGGDPDRKDINYTKFEFTFFDTWNQIYTLKLKLKPTVNWIEAGESSSVGELEGGMFFARNWRTWLMLGHRLLGPDDVPGTYDKRVEINVARTF